MYSAAGLISSRAMAQRCVRICRAAMLNSTPERYSQVRIRNGSSWLKSLTVEPTRATSRPIADIEDRLQQQGRDRQQPVPGDRLVAERADEDDGQDRHRQQHLLELDHHVRERQARARELQRPDQRQAVGDHGRRRDDGPLGEIEYEHAGDEESQVVGDTSVDLQQHAEDQEVDAGVQQRGEHLPELAQPGLGVHGDVAGGGERDDEAHTPPELAEVARHRRARCAGPQAILGGQLRKRHVRQLPGQGAFGGQIRADQQLPRGAEPPVVAHRARR